MLGREALVRACAGLVVLLFNRVLRSFKKV